MQWIKDRLREDGSRSGIAQLSVLVVLIALLLGVDVGALLTRAEGSTERLSTLAGQVVALMAMFAGPAATIARIVTPQPPAGPSAALSEAAAKGLERFEAVMSERKP